MLAPRSFAPRVAKPKSDPRFVAVAEQAKSAATKLKQHPTAATKAKQASKSTKPPANERLAAAKAKVVDAVKEAPAPKPAPTSFKALLRAEIDKAMPKTLGDTEKFMGGGAQGQMKGAASGGVSQQKEAATGPVDKATKKPPDAGAIPEQPATPLPAEPGAVAPPIAGGQAMPLPATAQEVSLQETKQDTEQALKDEKIKPESLPKANDPRFTAVADAKGKVAAQADKAPAAFRAKEAGVLAKAGAQAAGNARAGALLMAGRKGAGNAKVLTRQQQQAAKEEAERAKVAATVEGIYTRTKTRVETKLGGLDAEVSAIFDPGVDAAIAQMKTYVDDLLFDYKVRRYLSIPLVGLARWLRDAVLNLPDEVNVFYTQGRAVFTRAMDALIDRVAALVEKRLAEAKAEVAAGQAEIKAYVASLPANLQAAGKAAETAVNDRFKELEEGIESKKNEIAAGLAQKYKEAFDKADEALKQMQEENKGLMSGFLDKLGEIVKALMEFKAKLLGLLKKGMETIQLILDDPIGFLGNLIAAVKGGFNAFLGAIGKHLRDGFFKWLLGSLAAMGIALPADLSIMSVFKLVLDVLGITYPKLRAKAVKLIGETAVTVIEKVAEYVQALFQGGVAALWEKVKEDLSSLKDMVIGAIQDWLIETVVKQAITKIVSMFNPAGAIIQAILAIYNVVMFVIEKAQQIMALVEAVINSVHAIATGAIGGAIKGIETALASAIPVLIGFLARLLGLSGISEKIQGFIKKVQAKVDAAIDKVIAKIVGVVKKLFGGGSKSLDPDKQKKIDAGELAIQAVAAKYADGVAESDVLNEEMAAVKRAHPVFTSLSVEKQGAEFFWSYKANPTKKGKISKQSAEWAVGTHTVPKPVKVRRAKGESHHVPQKILLGAMGEFFEAAATPIKTVHPDLGKRMASFGKARMTALKSGGQGLSAIWLKSAVHDAAHQPVALSDVIKEAQKLADKGESLDTRADGAEIGGTVAMPAAGLRASASAGKLASNFSVVGRAPDSGKTVDEVNAHVRRSNLFAAVGEELGGQFFGSSKATKRQRAAATRKIASGPAKKTQAEALNRKAMALFKAQWNGLLVTGLAGVGNALTRDPNKGWKSELTSQAHATWAQHLSPP
ncbi:phage tail protein [Roseateles sp. BYS96W]|uniref:Uncharacterized protein n=1 Tax=Pelomonas nitida TaxID=3299027 RepID=A0ABW7G7E5_9BURK